MFKSSLWNYINAYKLVSQTIAITGAEGACHQFARSTTRERDKRNSATIFKNCSPFTDCKRKIINTKIDNVKYLDVMMLICKLM